MKSIKPEVFFKQIAVLSGVTDLKTVKDIYYGLIRTMSRELRDKHVIKLPDWGEFNLKMHKSRRSRDVNDGVIRIIESKPTIKFTTDHKVKKYFRYLSDESTVI